MDLEPAKKKYRLSVKWFVWSAVMGVLGFLGLVMYYFFIAGPLVANMTPEDLEATKKGAQFLMLFGYVSQCIFFVAMLSSVLSIFFWVYWKRKFNIEQKKLKEK